MIRTPSSFSRCQTRSTERSLPGIKRDEKTTVSPGSRSRSRCVSAAIRAKAEHDLKPFDVDVETTPYVQNGQGDESSGDRWTLNFGPQHPATHTTLRIVLELDGERVARATPHIGYLHSGFEKLAEHLDYNQYVTIVSRMNYVSPISNDG